MQRLNNSEILALKRGDFLNSREAYYLPNRSIEDLIKSYIEGIGSYFDHVLYEVRDLISEYCLTNGYLIDGIPVFDVAGCVSLEYLKKYTPDLEKSYFIKAPEHTVEKTIVFDQSKNEYADTEFPPEISMLIHREDRPAFYCYSTQKVEVFCHPYGYQVISRSRNLFWTSASPKSYSRFYCQGDEIDLDGDLIIACDRFMGENFSHILFDWFTRIGHFLQITRNGQRDFWVLLGGAPNDYIDTMIDAATKMFGISRDRFILPDKRYILRISGTVSWFSDQVVTYLHPAQMAHPSSIATLRGISKAIITPSSAKRRIYISRRDAERRKVSNEDELIVRLSSFGFEPIELSKLPICEQISTFKGADYIIAPHGMGVTHITMNDRSAALLELHHPSQGTDAYAFVATALQNKYNYLVGKVTDQDYANYEVDIDRVEDWIKL